MKLCIDCKHYNKENIVCFSPHSYNNDPSPVDGKRTQFEQSPYYLREAENWCGKEGKWWEAK